MLSRPSMASDTVWGEIVGRRWVQSFKKPLYPRKQLTNGIPDAKQGPGPRGRLHHQVNIHEDADQWEERQSRDLWAVSSSLNTAQTSERETLPHVGGRLLSSSGFAFSAY